MKYNEKNAKSSFLKQLVKQNNKVVLSAKPGDELTISPAKTINGKIYLKIVNIGKTEVKPNQYRKLNNYKFNETEYTDIEFTGTKRDYPKVNEANIFFWNELQGYLKEVK